MRANHLFHTHSILSYFHLYFHLAAALAGMYTSLNTCIHTVTALLRGPLPGALWLSCFAI